MVDSHFRPVSDSSHSDTCSLCVEHGDDDDGDALVFIFSLIKKDKNLVALKFVMMIMVMLRMAMTIMMMILFDQCVNVQMHGVLARCCYCCYPNQIGTRAPSESNSHLCAFLHGALL